MQPEHVCTKHAAMSHETEVSDPYQRLKNLQEEKDVCAAFASQTSRRLTALDTEILAAKKELAALESRAPTVTDHALLRFIERRLNVDLNELRRAIIPTDPRILTSIAVLGNGVYPVDDSHRVVIKNGAIVTVLPLND